MSEKKCSKCGKIYTSDLINFPPDKKAKDGLHSQCRPCNNLRYKKYRKENLNKIKEVKKQYRENNKEALKEYRQANKDYFQRYNEEHKEHRNARVRQLRVLNRDKLNVKGQQRRVMLLKEVVHNNFTYEDWCDILDFYEDSCAYCGKKTRALQIEHIIPITKLGSHSKFNIVCACPKCNGSKTYSDFSDWYSKQLFCSDERLNRILQYLHKNEAKDPQDIKTKEEVEYMIANARSILFKNTLRRL